MAVQQDQLAAAARGQHQAREKQDLRGAAQGPQRAAAGLRDGGFESGGRTEAQRGARKRDIEQP
jgi:hypothetical protein